MKIYKSNGAILIDVPVDDNSYRHREIMGDNSLTLYFSLAEHLEIPLGAYVEFEGERYTLNRPEALKMQHSRFFEYTVTFESGQARAKIWKFRNTVDGRLKFSLTAKPQEHLKMFVDNMNIRDKGWTVGKCIDSAEKCINYDHAYCWDALGQMAEEFDTEFEIVGKTVSLHKVEYNKTSPLPLSYGKGNGFVSGVGRSNYNETPPIEILYAQGGTDNIDASVYGASELHMPKNGTLKYDGEKFEDENGFNESKARIYVADDKGFSIRRLDKALSTLAEDSLDCTGIYPKHVGAVSEVVCVDADNNFYDIIDSSIPDTLNYEDCLIEGETMTIIFQSGMLAGKEFEVKYYHDAKDGKKKGRRFEIVPQEIDGQTMPNKTFCPENGNSYAVFHCMLPEAYINSHKTDNDPKTGAEWDMMRQCVRYLYDNEEENFTFTGTLDGIWAKRDWVNIGGKILLGGYVLFTDARFQKEGALIRIIGIKDYINSPHSPELELSNSTVTGSFGTTLQTLTSSEVIAEDYHRNALQFTKRRFRDAKETLSMLEQALLDNFTNSITPISVQTMAMLVGDESLQFRFVDSKETPNVVELNITYDNTNQQIHCPAAILQHLTMGIDSISPSHEPSEYRFWDMEEYTSGTLGDGSKKYYLYAKVRKSKRAVKGTFLLSEKAIKIETNDDQFNYYLLVGILNSEYDGERSFVPLYGFTEILPGRITTDRVVSAEGNSYFDLLSNSFKLGDVLDFNSSGDGKLVLKGTIVQSQSGKQSYIGCYRGEYNANYTYYEADEVHYTDPSNNLTSMYRMISSTPIKNTPPTNTTYWQVIAQGAKGEDGVGIEIKGVALAHYESYGEMQSECTVSGRYLCSSYPSGMTSKLGAMVWILDNGTWIMQGLATKGDCYSSKKDGHLYSANTLGWDDAGNIKGEKGDKGDNGANGTNGDFYEFRYAKNGSVTDAPYLNKSAVNPSGWHTEMPTIGTAEYLWMTSSCKTYDGASLVSNWSTPTRITPYNGKDGENGKSPVMLFRGEYSHTEIYYGNSYRLDCVRKDGTYYIARIDSGTFSSIAPPDSTKWNAFGGSFESVATQLLLAENANIAGWIFRNGRLESESKDKDGNPMAYLDGKKGDMRLRGVVQFSTAYSGDISDSNIFYLPKLNTGSKDISMGNELEDIGKVVRLYNSSDIGGGQYNIRANRFEISGNTTTIKKSFYAMCAPQEIVELTCFEQSGSSTDIRKAEWLLTGRFGLDDYKNSSASGRFPRALAVGTLIGQAAEPYFDGHFWNGKPISSVFSVTSSESGVYKISFPAGTLSSGYFVFITVKDINLKGVIAGQSDTGFWVYLSEDGAFRSGNVNFIILDPNWYYTFKV